MCYLHDAAGTEQRLWLETFRVLQLFELDTLRHGSGQSGSRMCGKSGGVPASRLYRPTFSTVGCLMSAMSAEKSTGLLQTGLVNSPLE